MADRDKARPRRLPSESKPKIRASTKPTALVVSENRTDARVQFAEVFGQSPGSPMTNIEKKDPTRPTVTIVPLEEKFDRLECILALEKDYKYLKGHPVGVAKTGFEKSTHSSEISSSDDESTNNKTYMIPRKAKTIPILFDAHYRGENPIVGLTGPPEIEAQGIWCGERKLHDMNAESDSEVEPEIGEYIASLKAKRKAGESLTGETFWYDEERSIVRNLHANSVSLTSYGDHDHMIFGRADILHPTLTPSERKMLGIRNSTPGPNGSTAAMAQLPRVYSKKSNVGLDTRQSQSQLDRGMGDGFHASLEAKIPTNLK